MFLMHSYQDYCGVPEQPEPSIEVRELNELDYRDVLAYLAKYPQQGLHLESIINDYGLTSPSLRGKCFGFYQDGRLDGVALIGHQIILCAPDEALAHFAQTVAESGIKSSVIFGKRRQVEIFWEHLSATGRKLKSQREFFWHVCVKPAHPLKQLQLIQAAPEELEQVMEAQATMFIEATGNDPRVKDAEGFRRRTMERIERGRTWIKMHEGKVIFKAELQSITPDAIYLEGIWTHPDYRGQGLAKSCVVEITHRRLRKQQVICLVVEPEEEAARRIYEYAGFEYQDDYQAIYLEPVVEG